MKLNTLGYRLVAGFFIIAFSVPTFATSIQVIECSEYDRSQYSDYDLSSLLSSGFTANIAKMEACLISGQQRFFVQSATFNLSHGFYKYLRAEVSLDQLQQRLDAESEVVSHVFYQYSNDVSVPVPVLTQQSTGEIEQTAQLLHTLIGITLGEQTFTDRLTLPWYRKWFNSALSEFIKALQLSNHIGAVLTLDYDNSGQIALILRLDDGTWAASFVPAEQGFQLINATLMEGR